MIRDILVHLDASSASEARMAYAIAVAQRHRARLTGLHVIAPIDVPPVFRPSVAEGIAEEWQQDAVSDAASTEAAFRRALDDQDIIWDWQRLEGSMVEQICNVARSMDLVIVGQYEAEGSSERHPLYLAQDLVTQCGRPLVVIPAKISGAAALGRALVAWDGSREAVRAIHDALPLLAEAKTSIDLIVVDSDDVAFDALVSHLSRHGIAVDDRIHVHEHHTVGRTLVDKLDAGHFDLLVMGAYGHPAWLELLFGGVTNTAMIHATTPVLVSH